MHGYIYYRWTDRYVAAVKFFLERRWLIPRAREALGRRLADGHHAKVVPTCQARSVITLDRPIEWRDLERAVPFELARDILLEASPRIALAECACRAAARRDRPRKAHGEDGERPSGDEAGRCGPVDSCLYVGEAIATAVVRLRPDKARLIDRDEAIGVVEAAAARGNMHTLWFKDAAAGRMYAICNCCSCCCVGLAGHREGFGPLVPSGFVVDVDVAGCDACGACEPACPFDAIALGASAVVDPAACHGCGVCVGVCPAGVLHLESAPGGVERMPL